MSRFIAFGSTLIVVLALFVLSLPLESIAQRGVVRYDHTRPLFQLPTDQVDQLLDDDVLEGTHVTISRVLFFDDTHSLMYPSNDESYETGGLTGDGQDVGWEFIDSTYIQHKDSLSVESRKFYRSTFLIKDSLPSWSWKLSLEPESSYLGYRVVKSTSVTDAGKLEAWYTPEIPVTAGPGLFHGLPGLILMVTNIDTGEIYVAQKVNLVEHLGAITPPVNGKQISPKKYDDFVEDVVEENQRKWEITRDAILNATPTTEPPDNW